MIKGTRDVQKAAKQAIFSLHRGDTAGAGKKLKDAHDAALAIKRDHLDELPTLRQVRLVPRDPSAPLHRLHSSMVQPRYAR